MQLQAVFQLATGNYHDSLNPEGFYMIRNRKNWAIITEGRLQMYGWKLN